MKVYMVFAVHEFEGEHFRGVYSTRDKAETAVLELMYYDSYYDYNIYENEVE